MEESRLKPMVNHDPRIFKDLYEKVNPLKRKLASEIDCRRFGVDYEEILSWFDVKFIYVFNKYYHSQPERLLGYIINSLKLFKCRILRGAYTEKFSQSISSLDYDAHDVVLEDDNTPQLISSVKDYMRVHLSDNAYEYFILTLYPPPFILNELERLSLAPKSKIPDEVIMDYYDIGNREDGYRWIKSWKVEIKKAMELAKVYFNKA